MLEPYFKKEDFILCDVPVPEGYPQSQTHAGIAVYNGRWYLTTSPFPMISHSKFVNYLYSGIHKITKGVLINPKPADRFENPCLYIGETGENPPCRFSLLPPSPLMDTPEKPSTGHAYNSDPDIFIDGDYAYILNRVYSHSINNDGSRVFESKVYFIKGRLSIDRFEVNTSGLLGVWNSSSVVSHSLTKYDDLYRLIYIDSKSSLDASTFNGLYIKSSESVLGLRNVDEVKKVRVEAGDMLPWHLSLFQYDGDLYTIIACVKKGDPQKKVWQMLGKFDRSLSLLHVYNRPLSDYWSYRGCAYVTPKGLFVLYNTTWNERVRGTKSVDGKDIIMANVPMENLLKEL